MTTDKIEIHTDPLNDRLINKLDQMRPKIDPIPAAKSRALVIGTGAAGLALVIAACALVWNSIKEGKRLDIAQSFQLEVDQKKAAAEIDKLRAETEAKLRKAEADIENARLKTEAEAEVIRSGAKLQLNSQYTTQTPDLSPFQLNDRQKDKPSGGDQTDIQTTVTVFKTRSFNDGSVMTGWSYPTSSARQPSFQFCYFTRSSGPATSDRLELANNRAPTQNSAADRTKVGLSKQQVAEARNYCQWFSQNAAHIEGAGNNATVQLAHCSIGDIENQKPLIDKTMQFCNGGEVRLVAFGEIKTGTYIEFRQALEALSPQTILLDSPGGVVSEARQMAKLIRNQKINTHALMQCNSACIAVMSAGIIRTANKDAIFGVHQPAWADPEQITREVVALYRAESRSLYLAHGVDPHLEALEWAVPNTRLKAVSVSEARTYKLVNG